MYYHQDEQNDVDADADDSANETISQALHAEELIDLFPRPALMSLRGIAAVSAASTTAAPEIADFTFTKLFFFFKKKRLSFRECNSFLFMRNF